MIINETSYYYYFHTSMSGKVSIVKRITEVYTALFTRYEALTEEQVAFYLEHPEASVDEVRRCELNVPYTPPEVAEDLQEIKANAVKELKHAMYEIMDEFPVLDIVLLLANKELSTYLSSSETMYGISDYRKLGKDFCIKAKQCKEVVNTYEAMIAEAVDADAVDAALVAGKEALNGI